MAYPPPPPLQTNFYVSKRIVSNKYNYAKFFLKKKSISNSKVECSCLCICCNCSKTFFADIIIGQTPLPPRVLTSYVNGPLLITSLKSLMEHRINTKVPCFMWEGRLDKSSKAVNIFCLFLGIPCCYALVHFWNRGHQYSSL